MTNPFIRLITLKQEEAKISAELPQAKAEAIAYYKENPVLTGKKTTGQFSKVGDQELPAILTWKTVSRSKSNPDYESKSGRLKEVKESLETIHAEKLQAIDDRINELIEQRSQLLANEETEKLLSELRGIPSTIKGDPQDELTVTLPK